MNYVFPYNSVEKGSRIAIYGFGLVGRDFFEQIISFGYCEIVLCVDKSFESYDEINRPFGKINELNEVEYDYLVIAVENAIVAKEIR